MASAPLNWLLKIGSAALKTTEQTLTGAVNELKDSISGLQSQTNSQFSTVTADILKKVNKTDVLSLEEIEATTNLTDKIAAAEAVKEVNSSVGTINLYVGTDGKLHFVDSEGADTVIPFSPGVKSIQCRFNISGDTNGHWRNLNFYINEVRIWGVSGNNYAAYPITGNVFNVTVNLKQFEQA